MIGRIALSTVNATTTNGAAISATASDRLKRLPLVLANGFMAEFCEFLTNDARHDLWLHSPESDATLVCDRDDLIISSIDMDL